MSDADADLTGAESAVDIFKAVVKNFSHSGAQIIDEDGVAYLKIQFDIPTNYVCKYQVDRILLPIFDEAASLYDHYKSLGMVEGDRTYLVATLAYISMSAFLTSFLVHHVEIFRENSEETGFLTETIFVQSLAKVHSKHRPDNEDQILRTLNLSVRERLDSIVESIAKNRRDFLAGYLNKLPLLTIPTGVGRPAGSTKPLEKKRQEAAEFGKKMEIAIRDELLANPNKPLNKTAVARRLAIGGRSSKTGYSSRLSSFNKKIKRYNLNYAATVERIAKTIPKNSS